MTTVVGVVVAPYLPKQSRDLLKAAGVSYMDMAGNWYIEVRAPGNYTLIDVERRPRRLTRRERRMWQGVP